MPREASGWEALMAYRNRVRSLLAVSVFALTAATPLLGAPAAVAMTGCDGSKAPPATPENVEFIVTVRDDGFSQQTISARVGDLVTFKLDDAAVKLHTLDWDQGPAIYRYTFDRDHGKLCRTYGPLRQQEGGGAATLHFYDAGQVPGYGTGGPFTGVLTVSPASSNPPPPSSSSSTTTTSVTAPPSSETTTTTMGPTTTTSEPTEVRPFLVPDAPTTTTTAAANPATSGAGPTKNGGTTATTANKDKGKSKAAGETASTLAPAAPVMPPDSVFDPGVLTPGPTTLPDAPAVSNSGDESSLNAASVLDLLEPEKAVDEDGNARLLLIAAIGCLGLLAVIGGFWWWGHRATRWDPA
jgi:hypothetical protein